MPDAENGRRNGMTAQVCHDRLRERAAPDYLGGRPDDGVAVGAEIGTGVLSCGSGK